MMWWLDLRRSIVNSHELYVLESDMLFLTSSHALLSHELSSDSHPTLKSSRMQDLVTRLSHSVLSLFVALPMYIQNKKKVYVLNSISRDSG